MKPTQPFHLQHCIRMQSLDGAGAVQTQSVDVTFVRTSPNPYG